MFHEEGVNAPSSETDHSTAKQMLEAHAVGLVARSLDPEARCSAQGQPAAAMLLTLIAGGQRLKMLPQVRLLHGAIIKKKN